MVITDIHKIGNRLYQLRKSRQLTQSEAAERAGVSDRTYADIERGSTTMRIDTLTKICQALQVTPNDILVEPDEQKPTLESLFEVIRRSPDPEQTHLHALLYAYLKNQNLI